MTTAEKILNNYIKCDIVRDYDETSRKHHTITLESALKAINQALQQSHVSGEFCRCTGRIFVTSENGIRTCNECMKRIS